MKKLLSKINFVAIAFAVVALAVGFIFGSKYGDAAGYEAGFTEGYRYDCKEEIANIYDQVKNLSKSLEFTKSNLVLKAGENDSLRWEIRRAELQKKGDPKGNLTLGEMKARQRKQFEELKPILKELKSGGKK